MPQTTTPAAGVPGDRPRATDRTTWRYLMTRERLSTGEDYFAIREVYEDPDGKLSWTEDEIGAAGDSVSECAAALQLMARAAHLPVLDLTLDPPRLVSNAEARAWNTDETDESREAEESDGPISRVHSHPPYEPMCNERWVGTHLRGACLNDDGTSR